MTSHLPSGRRLVRAAGHLEVVERDLLEQVRDQSLVLRTRLGAQPVDQVTRGCERRPLQTVGLQQRAKGTVDRLLSQDIAEEVHHHATLLVPDVRLPLDPRERHFADAIGGPSAEIAVEGTLEESPDFRDPVHPLHHHERRVLGERLRQHRLALHVRADHLVRPPLMPGLVRRHVRDAVDPARVPGVDDEAGCLGEGDGAREGLREVHVGRKLHDAHLPELERTEVLRVVVERRLHGSQHPIHADVVGRMVVDGQVDVPPFVLSHRVPGGLNREEEIDRRLGLEVRDPPAVDDPAFLEMPRGHDGLIRLAGHRDFRVDPIGVVPEIVEGASAVVLQLGRPELGHQAVSPAHGAVLQDHEAGHPDPRRDLEVVEERPVGHDPRLVVAVPEPVLLPTGLEPDFSLLARLERPVEGIDPVVQVGEFLGQVRAVHLERLHLEVAEQERAQKASLLVAPGPGDVDFPHRGAGLVLDDVAPPRHDPRFVGIEVDVQGDVSDLRLRNLLERKQGLLIFGLPPLTVLKGAVGVQDVGVVVDVPAEPRHQERRRRRRPTPACPGVGLAAASGGP